MVFAAVSAGKIKRLAAFDADFLAEIGMIKGATSAPSVAMKKVAVKVVLKKPVYVESIRFPRSNMSFWGWFQKYRYSDISFMYVHFMPSGVGSAVLVLHTSVSPKYIKASRSNCRPRDVTVKFMTTRLNWHDGGV